VEAVGTVEAVDTAGVVDTAEVVVMAEVDLLSMAAGRTLVTDGVVMHPALMGTRTPSMDVDLLATP
jgi:hypothetical protein